MKSFGKSATATVLFLSLFVTSTSFGQVLATAGAKTITVKEFNDRYEQIRKQSTTLPPKDLFLEDLIRFEIGVQEAEKRNLREDPMVRDRINQELYKALVEFELAKKIDEIKISEADLKRFYETNPELRTSHILIEVKGEATKEQKAAAKKRAEEIYDEVKKANGLSKSLLIFTQMTWPQKRMAETSGGKPESLSQKSITTLPLG